MARDAVHLGTAAGLDCATSGPVPRAADDFATLSRILPMAAAPSMLAGPDAGTAAGPPRSGQGGRGPGIQDLPILRDAAPEALRRATERAAWRSYPAGALILDIEDTSSDVFFVVEGAVRVQVRTAGGRELILAELPVGEMFGEIAAIDGEPRTATVTATLPCRLCSLPAEAFLDAATSSPAACLALLRHTTRIFRRQNQRVVEREALPVRLRLCAELLRLSRPRAGATRPGERIISPPPTQQDIAARIGARREAVSRELSDMARHGLVEKVRGGVVIPRPDALAAAITRGEQDAGVRPARG
jgi:CRP-like cAMP-binding protein